MNAPLILELQLHEYLQEKLVDEFTDIDEETLNDTLEGLTSLHEKLAAVIRSQQRDGDMVKALKERISEMRERLKRFEQRIEKKRELVTYVMERADIIKLNEPDFNAFLRALPLSLAVLTLERALKASGCDSANVIHKPRLLSDNRASYISGDLADWLED